MAGGLAVRGNRVEPRFCRRWSEPGGRGGLAEDLAAKHFAAAKLAARLRARLVEGAKLCHGVQGDAGAVSPLVHAARAGVFNHERLRHHVVCSQRNHQVAAAAAAGAGWDIGVVGDGGGSERLWR